MWLVIRPERPPGDRGAALGETVLDQRADGGGEACASVGAAPEVVAHLVAEAPAERARIGEESQPEEPFRQPAPERHAAPSCSKRRDRADTSWLSSLAISALATATPRGVMP